jgi:uncharacterized small protein (DUF1192 family)
MTEETTQITLQDIDAVVRVIDAVCARGAIRGPELTSVGTLREKFAGILQEEVDRQKAAAEADAASSGAAPAEVAEVPVEAVDDADLSTLS